MEFYSRTRDERRPRRRIIVIRIDGHMKQDERCHPSPPSSILGSSTRTTTLLRIVVIIATIAVVTTTWTEMMMNPFVVVTTALLVQTQPQQYHCRNSNSYIPSSFQIQARDGSCSSINRNNKSLLWMSQSSLNDDDDHTVSSVSSLLSSSPSSIVEAESSPSSPPSKERTISSQSPNDSRGNNSVSNSRKYSSNNNRNNNNNNTNRGSNSNFKKKTYNNNNIFDTKDKQLNQLLVRATTAKDVLLLLQQHSKLQSYKAGDTLNNVNHSTSLHRLAKHAVTTTSSTTTNTNAGSNTSSNSNNSGNNYKQNRAMILSDPRFALLVTSIAEHMATTATSTTQIRLQQTFFQTRELSNIGWALSKLKLPPPLSVISSCCIIQHPPTPQTSTSRGVPQRDNDESNDSDDSYYLNEMLQTTNEQLLNTAAAVREAVIRVATERAKIVDGTAVLPVGAESWIPLLSQLAGQILDAIGVIATVLDHISQQNALPSSLSTSSSSRTSKQPKTFQMQEWSNLLWAWATAGRADPTVFGLVVRNMIQQQKQKSMQQPSQNNINNNSNNEMNNALQPQEWSNSIWAFATAQCYESHIDLIEYVAELLDTHPEFINDFKSQELSNTIWGIATLLSNKKLQPQYSTTDTSVSSPIVSSREQRAALTILRHVIQSVIRRNAEGFRTQELSNTAWATATLGFGINQGQETSVMNNYLVMQSDSPEEDTKLMVDMMYAIADSAMRQLPRFWSQELNNLAWAVARLLSDNNNLSSISNTEFETRITSLLRGIASQLADPRRSVNSQDIGTTLWSLATLEFCDKELYRSIAIRLTPEQAHRSKPQELSNTIWAFATAEMEINDMDVFDTTLVPSSQRKSSPTDPITACFGVAAYELMHRPHSFKPQEIKDVLWSFSKVGLRHPELFKFVAEHLVGSENDNTDPRGLDDFSTQGLGNMAWAFARQAQLSEMVSDRLNLNTGNGKMSTYKTIYFDVGENLLLKFFSSIAETNIRVYDKLGKGKPQDITNTAWAFASLGLKDERYMDAAKDALVDRLSRYAKGEKNAVTTFKGQELANLLWAMATLNVSAGNVWSAVMLFLRSTCTDNYGSFSATSISRYFKRQELASMAWACSVFGNYPEELMQFLYTGLFGLIGKEQEPKRMENIYKDSGLQMQAIMTLIYVQTEIDKRGICRNLSLPENFPDGWIEAAGVTNTKDDHITALSLELNLSTSKIQRAVSAAFLRIGYSHVEEHTITMQEMAESHGVRIPSKNIEVLSIDIANVQQKVAVEVDGPSHFVSRTDDYWEGMGSSGGYSKLINGKLEYQFGWTGERQEMNGPTVLKDRLLTSFGWKVLHLPFWEWYALGGDSVAEEKYCQVLLDKLI